MKTCTKCLKEKPITDFPYRLDRKCYRKWCYDCKNLYYREYHKNNTKHAKRLKNNKNKRKKFIIDIKLSNGCCICGYKKCARALDFHHLNKLTKEFNIAGGLHRRSSKAIIEEIKKCVVVCSNCHREVEDNLVQIPINSNIVIG